MEEPFPVSVKCLAGCEDVLADEMKTLGAEKIVKGIRIVQAEVDMAWVYRANLCLRTALRILIPIKSFRAKTPEVLYHKAKKIWWEEMFTVDHTFALDFTVNSRIFTHGKFASLKVKDAIVDRFRMSVDRRPSVNTESPDYRFHLHIQEEQCTISIDSSARSLHMRGYRVRQGVAPINEVLAASIIAITGWNGDQPFINPMCGSGTFLIEAAKIASNEPAQVNHDFGFKRWPDYQPKLWEQALQYARDHRKSTEVKIIGFDRDAQAINNLRKNLDIARCASQVSYRKENFFTSDYNDHNTVVIMNPPYDVRLKEQDVVEMYSQIGDTLKHSYAGNTVWIITGNFVAAKRIGLRTSMKKPLWNGSVECRLLKFDMYRGKR